MHAAGKMSSPFPSKAYSFCFSLVCSAISNQYVRNYVAAESLCKVTEFASRFLFYPAHNTGDMPRVQHSPEAKFNFACPIYYNSRVVSSLVIFLLLLVIYHITRIIFAHEIIIK